MMDQHLHRDKLQRAFSFNKEIILQFIFWNNSNLLNVATNCNAIIISGSHWRVLDKNTPTLPKSILQMNKPILGICYGYQLIIKELCGEDCIDTFADGKLHSYDKMLSPYKTKKRLYHFMHHDYVVKLPDKWEIDIISRDNKQIWAAHYKNIIGIQFHPEYHRGSSCEFCINWVNKFIN